MDIISILFLVFAAVVIGSAGVVVFSKNIMFSAFALLFTLFGIAGLYVLLNADFIAITQIMIYIGGILVLIIFGVMLTTKITQIEFRGGLSGKIQLGTAGLATALLAFTLVTVFMKSNWLLKGDPNKVAETTVNSIGTMLLSEYLIQFEIASVLLLVAIIGATFIARRK
ncbi:MAG: NADH-quinone oxidoreductase subunit J [bacterium]